MHSSQEVRNKGLVGDGSRSLVSQGIESLEGVLKFLVDVEDGGDVTASVAVVWCRPDSDKVLVLEPELVTIHDELMGTGDQVDVVDVVEFGSNLGSEEPSGTSWRHGPGLDVLWVGPHEVAEWALMRDLHASVDESNLVDGLDLGGESTMDTEYLTLDDGTDTEIVEDFCAVFPWVGVSVLSDGLIVEAVDGGDLAGLVVTSQESDVCWILHLEAEKELEGLDGVESTINEVTHEDVASVWDLTAFVEKFEQVVELTVDISTNCDWSLDWLDVALLDEDLLDLFAEDAELALWKDGTLFNSLKPVVDVR